MKIVVEKIKEITLEGEEVNQLWRLLKNECEGANTAERTTYEIYGKLRRWFSEE